MYQILWRVSTTCFIAKQSVLSTPLSTVDCFLERTCKGHDIENEEPSSVSPGQLVPGVVSVNHDTQLQTLAMCRGSVGTDFLLDVAIKGCLVTILEISVIIRRLTRF